MQLLQSASALGAAGTREGRTARKGDSGRKYKRESEEREESYKWRKRTLLCVHRWCLKICLARVRANIRKR